MSINPLLLQKALLENSSDLQDFSKDLKSWGEEMKRKEDVLKNKDNNQKPTPSNKIRRVEKKPAPKKIGTGIGTTDYSKWDKFDVEAELEKLDDEDEEDSELTDECNDNMYDEAILEKEKGNKFVKIKKWDEAIICYTKAIDCHSYDPIFYANRALCYLKKNKFEDAERDCNLSLKLDAKYVKALQRRAAARIALDKLEDAELDLLRVLQIERKNKESQAELAKVRAKLNRVEKSFLPKMVSKFTASRSNADTFIQPTFEFKKTPGIECETNAQKLRSPWPEIDNIIPVKPIKKPPHSQSKKPLRRIAIVEIDSIAQETEEAVKDCVIEKKKKVPAPTVEEKVVEKVVRFAGNEEHMEKKVTGLDSKETPVKTEPSKIISSFKKNKVAKDSKASNATALPRSQDRLKTICTDDLIVVERSPETPDTNNGNLKIDCPREHITVNNNIIESDKTGENECSQKAAGSTFSAPKNSVQFNQTWKNCNTSLEKYMYLTSIDPVNFPKIFLESLDASIFSNILDILAEHSTNNRKSMYDILESFTHVKRFSAITMFLSSDNKKNLWTLIGYLRQGNETSKDAVDDLVTKYEI